MDTRTKISRLISLICAIIAIPFLVNGLREGNYLVVTFAIIAVAQFVTALIITRRLQDRSHRL